MLAAIVLGAVLAVTAVFGFAGYLIHRSAKRFEDPSITAWNADD